MDPQDSQAPTPQSSAGEQGPDLTSLQDQSLSQSQPISQVKRERMLDEDEDEDDERKSGRERRKIEIKFISDKSRRHITFSKRKAGIMKKAYELSILTGTQVLLLVVSETGLVYTFTTPKLQPLVTEPDGKNLIQACLNAPETRQNGHELGGGAAAPLHDGGYDPNQHQQQPQAQQQMARQSEAAAVAQRQEQLAQQQAEAAVAAQRQQQEQLQAQQQPPPQQQQQPQTSPSHLGGQVPPHLSPGLSSQGLPRASMPAAPVPLQHNLGQYMPEQQFSYIPPPIQAPQQQRYLNPHQHPSPGSQ